MLNSLKKVFEDFLNLFFPDPEEGEEREEEENPFWLKVFGLFVIICISILAFIVLK